QALTPVLQGSSRHPAAPAPCGPAGCPVSAGFPGIHGDGTPLDNAYPQSSPRSPPCLLPLSPDRSTGLSTAMSADSGPPQPQICPACGGVSRPRGRRGDPPAARPDHPDGATGCRPPEPPV